MQPARAALNFAVVGRVCQISLLTVCTYLSLSSQPAPTVGLFKATRLNIIYKLNPLQFDRLKMFWYETP